MQSAVQPAFAAGCGWLCRGAREDLPGAPYAASSVPLAAARALLLPLRPSHIRPVASATKPLMGRLQEAAGEVGSR